MHIDADDPVATTVAARIAVDAREAGLTLLSVSRTPNGTARPDLRLVRARLDTTDAGSALAAVAASLGLADAGAPMPLDPLDRLLVFEYRVVSAGFVVPIVHLPELVGLGPRLRASGPLVGRDGAWNLADAWLAPERP